MDNNTVIKVTKYKFIISQILFYSLQKFKSHNNLRKHLLRSVTAVILNPFTKKMLTFWKPVTLKPKSNREFSRKGEWQKTKAASRFLTFIYSPLTLVSHRRHFAEQTRSWARKLLSGDWILKEFPRSWKASKILTNML